MQQNDDNGDLILTFIQRQIQKVKAEVNWHTCKLELENERRVRQAWQQQVQDYISGGGSHPQREREEWELWGLYYCTVALHLFGLIVCLGIILLCVRDSQQRLSWWWRCRKERARTAARRRELEIEINALTEAEKEGQEVKDLLWDYAEQKEEVQHRCRREKGVRWEIYRNFIAAAVCSLLLFYLPVVTKNLVKVALGWLFYGTVPPLSEYLLAMVTSLRTAAVSLPARRRGGKHQQGEKESLFYRFSEMVLLLLVGQFLLHGIFHLLQAAVDSATQHYSLTRIREEGMERLHRMKALRAEEREERRHRELLNHQQRVVEFLQTAVTPAAIAPPSATAAELPLETEAAAEGSSSETEGVETNKEPVVPNPLDGKGEEGEGVRNDDESAAV